MRVIFLITFLVMTGCAKDTQSYYIYPCGIEIDSCKVEVEGKRNLDEEIEFQEKEFKSKMLRTMTLIIDQTLQTLLQSIK